MTRHAGWMIAGLIGLTLLVYAGGLNGPFLFDDSVHITQNRWVKIETLQLQDLIQAWNSSFASFPRSRPLAQLSFGVTHALVGLEPWAFKAINLVLHLLTGLAIYVFVKLAHRAVHAESDQFREKLLGLVVAALWLLHPLHVSTVLYVVQRMAQLSTLSLVLALTAYLFGRQRVAHGESGMFWMLSAAPIAMLGFLGKENTVLLPLLLLVCEITLLGGTGFGNRRFQVRLVQFLFIALPLVLGAAYLVTHPGLLNHELRPFTLEERLMTQARVLWMYLGWLLIPDLSSMGLFHDDIPISRSLFDPPTTIFAISGIVVVILTALFFKKRTPLLSFAVLIFFAAHSLESSFLPLELVFEHRNYLAGLGPMLLLGFAITSAIHNERYRRAAIAIGLAFLTAYSSATAIRANNWSSYHEFLLTSVGNHPDSPRANFSAAQLMIAAIENTNGDSAAVKQAARSFLNNGLKADPNCINCLFGLIVLDLHSDLQPDRETINELIRQLREEPVGASKVSVRQYGFLVKWHLGDGVKMPQADIEAIFDAALANPRLSKTGRSTIESAYGMYHEEVTGDLSKALVHARRAADTWNTHWNYQMELARILRKLERYDEEEAVLDRALAIARHEAQRRQTRDRLAELHRESLREKESTPG